MKILKVISALVLAIVLTGLIIWGCIAWSQSLYIGVTEPEVLVLEQIGITGLGLGLISIIWVFAMMLCQIMLD